MKTKNLIIGAGISGLSFANYVDDYLIVEKEKEVGGYCRTIYQGDFIWDFAGHFFHFQSEEFRKKFIDDVPKEDFVNKVKKTYICYDKKLIDYPFQMNIHQLEKEEFVDCLYDLFNKEEKDTYDNFLDMLYGKFGKSIVEKFLKPYNEKLYACDLTILDKDAMGRFFPYADIKSIVNNMKKQQDSSYNNNFLYPKKGAQVIIDILNEKIDDNKVLLDTTVDYVDIKNKQAKLSDGTIVEFENLINTSPLPRFLSLLNEPKYTELSDRLTYNKVLVFNLGFNKKSTFDYQNWLYIPNKDINFYRVGFYDNILDGEKLSMYIEIGYDKNAIITNEMIEEQLKLTLENLKKLGITDDTFVLEESMSIIMDPAYVHISKKTLPDIKETFNELEKNNIYSIGRYGAWTYCSMEDCMVEAKKLADSI